MYLLISKMKFLDLKDRLFQFYIFNSKLNSSEFTIKKQIGIDSKTSNIYICVFKDSSREFCLKKNIPLNDLKTTLRLSSIVLRDINPHFLITYRYLKENNLICELATADLKSFLKSYISYNVLFNSVLQIILAVYSFHKYTGMKHNDVHHGNFLYHRINKTDSYLYYKIGDIDFYIKNEGYLWMINDYDLADYDDSKYEDYKSSMEAFKNYNKNKSVLVKTEIDKIIDIIWKNNNDNNLILELIKSYKLNINVNKKKYNKTPYIL